MDNKIISIIVVVIILAGGGFLLFKNRGIAPTGETLYNNVDSVPTNNGADLNTNTGTNEENSTINSNIKEFSIDATSFSFSPSTMVVNKGDTVKITVKNIKGTHDLKIDEFNTTTRILNVGESQTITFVADKIGTFEYYCSVGSHRANGMVGKLTIR